MTIRTPLEAVQGQLDAYNAQDLDAYMGFFAPDCVIADLNGAIAQYNAAEIRARYEKLFAEFPQNRAKLVNRIAVGETVIDHELVERTPSGPSFEVGAVYTVRNGTIIRVDFFR